MDKTFPAILCIFLISQSCAPEMNLAKKISTVKENSAIIPVPNPEPSIQDWWLPRQQVVNENLQKGSAQLLFIGNSIVNGFEGPGKEVWQKYYENRNALNMGFGWDRTQHLLWRIDHSDFTKAAPKLAIVLIGTNNIGRNTNEEIVQGISAVITRLKSKIPVSKILLLGILPRYEKDHPDRHSIRDINSQIATLADGDMIFFLDIGEVFVDDDNNISKEIMADLLHPTSAGYYLFAEALEPVLVELF